MTAAAWGALLATVGYALGGAVWDALSDWRWTRRQLRSMAAHRRRVR